MTLERAQVGVAALLLMAAGTLKLSYSHAGAGALAWVLAPSCWLAQHLGGVALVYEAGAGWISHRPRMVVGPACAGVNFLVVSWLALYFSQAGRYPSVRAKLALLSATWTAAYAATLATNGLRIALAAQLYAADFASAWLTPERAHRLLGVTLYCAVLLGLCRAADAVCGRARQLTAADVRIPPLGWYLAVVLGIPLANRAFLQHPQHFAEHAAFTLGAAGAVALLFWSGGWLARRARARAGGGLSLQREPILERRAWRNPEC